MRHVVVVGAGFAGLATCRRLLKRGVRVTLVSDSKRYPAASVIAAGLFQPYAGKTLNSRFGTASVEAITSLATALEEAQEYSDSPLFSKGVVRLAMEEFQEEAYRDLAAAVNDKQKLVFLDKKQTECLVGSPFASVLQHEGRTINCKAYLEALHTICLREGLREVEGCLESSKLEIKGKSCVSEALLRDIVSEEFDSCVLALGWGVIDLWPQLKPLLQVKTGTWKVFKGHVLQVELPHVKQVPPYSVSGSRYLAIHDGQFLLGSSYHNSDRTLHVDLEQAKNNILPHYSKMFPSFPQPKIIDCKAGIRLMPPNPPSPLLTQLDKKTHLFIGLASRGLLQHNFLADKLVESLVK